MSLRHDEETIQAVLDGTIKRAAFEGFQERLRREPELRQLYRSYARLDHTLLEKFEHSAASTVPAKRVAPHRRRLLVPLAAAAAIALAATLATGSLRPDTRATVEFGPESRGQVLQPNGGEDGFLAEGSRLRIDHGSAAVTLPDGTRALIEGPGSIEYRSRHWLHLDGGRTWIRAAADHHELTCTTDAFRISSPGREFGVIAGPGHREEIHVIGGELGFELRKGGDAAPRTLGAGHAAIWAKSALNTVPSPTSFASFFPEQVTVFAEDFSEDARTPLAGKVPDHGGGPWQVARGAPAIDDGLLDTSGTERTTAFAPLSGPPLDDSNHVILLTIVTDNPETSKFHSDGWAGVSLYAGDQERIFVGDPNGPARGWALHPVGSEARHACPLLEGKNVVTLRYDYRSGLAELYEGDTTTGPSLASEWIDPGLTFDRIRIANGSRVDAAIDAGLDPAVAGEDPGARERGDIALREVRVRVLSTADSSRPPRP